jgi:hypothetical protein
MIRAVFLAFVGALVCLSSLSAQAPDKDGGVQRAMSSARGYLQKQQPAEAITILEAELLNAEDSGPFLALLGEAYSAQLKSLESRKAEPILVDSVRRKIKSLESRRGGVTPASLGPTPVAGPSTTNADIRPPAPPIPEAPADVMPPTKSGTKLTAGSDEPPPLPPVPDDPFQQTPRGERPSAPGALARASQAFAEKQYAKASALFAEGNRNGEPPTAAQKDEWAYSRLHAVAVRLNKGKPNTAEAADLAAEVETAVRSGSERMAPFGNQLIEELRRGGTTATSAVPAGWESLDTPSFRIIFQGRRELAADVASTCETARKAMYERWVGPPAANWSPKCDIYLHASGSAYSKVTGKPAEGSGHSTVVLKAGHVASRRIDLRADDLTLLDGTVPFEVTQVVLMELFSEQPLPRWALIGMAALSESPERVALYRRAVPDLLKDRKLFAVGPFLERNDFSEPATVTAFYAQSVSLVAYLVELKGPKAFATFLREGPRRGYARALTTYYGFKDPAELQDRWVKHTLGGD